MFEFFIFYMIQSHSRVFHELRKIIKKKYICKKKKVNKNVASMKKNKLC